MKYKFKKLDFSDAKAITESANNKNVAKYLRDAFPQPYTLKDANEYINYAVNSKNDIIYGIVIENFVNGCISANFRNDVYKKSCELGYWLAEKYWGKGIMTLATKNFCDFIFQNYDINRIDAEIFAENIASQKVLEKVGFKFEGLHKKKIYKYKKFMDARTYALIRN